METIDVTIYKPVYGTFVYIRESLIKQAIREGKILHVAIPGIADAMIKPEAWLETGKRLEKVFKIPDKPMILWGNHVPLKTT